MPTAKDKGGAAPTTHHYRAASRYDDNTLAQKREYWRTKKREQRARRTARRGRSTQSNRGEQRRHLNAPVVVNSGLPGSFAAPSSPVWNNAELFTLASATPASQNPCASADIQKTKWVQHPVALNAVLTQLPAPCIDMAASKCRGPRRLANKAITSPTPTKTQLNTNSSVPPVRETRNTNGSCAQTTPQPCVSMQGTLAPDMQLKNEDALRTQLSLSPTDVFVKAEDANNANATPQSGTQSALVTSPRAKPLEETDEEKAAKRREQWQIKKREQRAKLAAQLGKARERTLGPEMLRQAAQKTALTGAIRSLSSQSFLKAAGDRRQCSARSKAAFTPGKRDNFKLQPGAGRLATVNLQVNVQNPSENRTTNASDGTSGKRPGDLLRRYPSYAHLSNISRAMVRCKTPRQRFIDAQWSFLNLRNMRCRSPFFTSVFASRNIPRIDPNDTPEQIIAKRREYWRVKKREQRAKLTMEMKSRLKERDSLMRRVKRYQSILEEMRRARAVALAQSPVSTLADASETIGGFIKEDGTVTVKIPQATIGHNTAAHTSNEELHIGSNNSPFAQPQNQANTYRRGFVPIRTKQPPQVRVSLPGQSVNKPTKLSPVRPRTQLRSTTPPTSQSLPNQAVAQLTLTRPRMSPNAISGRLAAGSNLDGCVMKMAISSGAVSPSTLCLDPSLTEEERMAKKREYWRVKKREQRAARAVRLKQGVLHARVNAALQRRRAQKQLAASVHQNRRLTNPAGSARPLSNANEIKQETVPEVDLHFRAEQTICADVHRPISPPPPPPPQLESDPALTAESQATTLLAVASMKKLLEESLSTVRESKCEQTDIKTEANDEPSEQEMKPILPQLFFEKDDVAPLAADLTLQIKSWQPDDDTLVQPVDDALVQPDDDALVQPDDEALVQADSPSPHLKESPPFSETPSPIPAPSEESVPPTCEHSSQTPSNFIVAPSMEASCVPSPLRRTQRLCSKKASCSPEPPKLHHIAMGQPHPQAQHAKDRCQKSKKSAAAQRCVGVVAEHVGLNSLQRKREYWKLMKRQQRARSKARRGDRHGEFSRRNFQTDIQVPGAFTISPVKGLSPPSKRALQQVSPLGANTRVPAVLVATSTTLCRSPESPLTRVSCSPRSKQNFDFLGSPDANRQASPCSPEWMSTSTDEDAAPSLPVLKPPENPLASINLQPIEPHGPTLLSPLKIPCPRLPSPTRVAQPPCKAVPVSAMAPPKRVPGEPEEDFLRRKREYWRIKKKEQRARKAVQVKGGSPRRAADNWRPVVQPQELATQEVMADPEPDYTKSQDCSQWVSSSESEHLMSSSADTASFPFPNYTSPLQDESEVQFPDYEGNDCEDGAVSDDVWRHRFLMDYDPLNQLLVCMVCGELQYSHSLEGVRAHIEDAHPHTLTLEARDMQGILEAWDEQVSQRERFFTSQLQQHSGSLAETQENR